MELIGHMRNKILFYLIGGLFIFTACEPTAEKEQPAQPPPVTMTAPAFNADSAYHYIQQQVDFGPRVPNSAAHRQCSEFLYQKLKGYLPNTLKQEFTERNSNTGETYQFTNIIGSYNPGATRRILLGAHWDTRLKADKDSANPEQQFDGANDGASGVGVLLEMARLISQDSLTIGVDFIFFDAEDQGNLGLEWCLGSKYWSRNKHQANYSAFYGILLDMVGAKDASFLREAYSMQYAPKIVRQTWNQAHQLGYSRYFIYKDGAPIEDDHYYVNVEARIPMIDIIDTRPLTSPAMDPFKDYHHRPGDNMDVIDRSTLQAVGHTVLQLLYNESAQLAQ